MPPRPKIPRATKEGAMAKFSFEVAVRVSEESIQIHLRLRLHQRLSGGKYWCDFESPATIGEGTSEIQRMVIARQLLKL